MLRGVEPTFPRLLGPAWRATDPASRCDRRCDALDATTPHQKLATARGDYWVCSVTGQMTRDAVMANLIERYDKIWEKEVEIHQPTEKDHRECRRWLDRVASYRKTGRLFEVGCGTGLFLTTANRAGWRAEGIELSPFAAEHARRVSGAKVLVGAMEDARLEASAYDVVLCNNVFEHLREPLSVLRKLSAALRPGGVIFFQTLSAQSLSLYIEPRGWLYFEQGHLFIPTLVSLRHYFELSGLEPVHFETHGFHSANAVNAAAARKKRVVFDKLMATVAARFNRGHRVKYLLRRSG